MASKGPNRSSVSQDETPAQLRRTPVWFIGSAFTSASAFEAFDNSLLPNSSKSECAPTRQWQEDNLPEDSREEFAGQFPILSENSIESWTFDSLSNLELISALDGSDNAGSSSGKTAESAYVSV